MSRQSQLSVAVIASASYLGLTACNGRQAAAGQRWRHGSVIAATLWICAPWIPVMRASMTNNMMTHEYILTRIVPGCEISFFTECSLVAGTADLTTTTAHSRPTLPRERRTCNTQKHTGEDATDHSPESRPNMPKCTTYDGDAPRSPSAGRGRSTIIAMLL